MHTLIDNASHEIIVEHAYIMDPGIVERLINAAERGVSVRLIRSMPENGALEAANEKFFAQLENRKNITITRSPRVLHAKLLHVDGKYTIIGSANLTRESLHFHEETALFFASGASDIHRELVQSAESGHSEEIEQLFTQMDQ
jgi:cardiolipin synthase A/B